MFTGIVETIGIVRQLVKEDENLHLYIESDITNELKIDQSVAHNGVCLTVVALDGRIYKVTAIQETLRKTTLGAWKVGDEVNLERGMQLGARLDGHIVQGHVDHTAECYAIEPQGGSTLFRFRYKEDSPFFTIPKGSITVNGTSLTVVDSERFSFSVAIIPYTMEHTIFKHLQIGDSVNLEFDVIGKYILQQQRFQ